MILGFKIEFFFVKRLGGDNKRKRKRVLKFKFFVDEEGCVVIEKVYESEFCIDSEEDFKKKSVLVYRFFVVVVKREFREDLEKSFRKRVAVLGKFNR